MNEMLLKLIECAKELNGALPFMEGKEKAEIQENTIYTISEYGYLTGDDGEYICFLTKEDKDHFYFGSSVLTQKMRDLEFKIADDMQVLLEHGIEVSFKKQKSKKSGFTYTDATLFPNN